jgi:hypothetical protein
MKHILLLGVILFYSCDITRNDTTASNSKINKLVSKDIEISNVDSSASLQLVEYFADSSNIGVKSFNKIEVSSFTGDSSFVTIKFWSKRKGKWNLKNSFQFEKDLINNCDTKISDFNNDGYKDMTYISLTAARGANEVRKLFIYDKIKDVIVPIKNSEEYPNMRYNKGLNCIDAFLIHGGCTTVFLKIEGDTLREFARVDIADGLTVREYDKKGRSKVILRKAYNENQPEYIRYRNYKPLKEYK